jgi:hypothetical protein
VNTPHPDLETLAELADRDITPASETAGPDTAIDPATAEILGHVAGCAACTADLEALRRVRETLRALPLVPMPADVAERIEAALLAAREPDAAAGPIAASSARSSAAPDTVVPLRSRSAVASRQRPSGAASRWRTMPYGAAASIVVVLAIIVVGAVALGHSGNNSKKSASSPAVAAAGTSAAASVTIASGTNYTAADLRSQVTSVVTSNVPDAAANFPGLAFGAPQAAAASAPAAAAASSAAPAVTFAAPAASASAAAAPSSPALAPIPAASPAAGAAVNGGTADRAASSPLSPITAPAGPLADPAALARCIQILAGKAEQPLLVDYATFNGAPSTIIVLPDPDVPHKLDVYVEADTANCANQEFTFETFLGPSPGP